MNDPGAEVPSGTSPAHGIAEFTVTSTMPITGDQLGDTRWSNVIIVGLAIAGPEIRVGFLAAVVSNAFFSTVHVVSNTVLFAILAPAVLPRLAGLRPGGEP